MEKLKKEIPFLAVAGLPFAYLAYLWNGLPGTVPIHWNAAGKIDGYGSKDELILILLLVCGLNYVIFLVLPYIDPKQKLQNMGQKLSRLRMILTIFLSALGIFILYSVQQQSSEIAFMFVIIGLLFTFMGNYFKTIKPNYFIGIRTPWTLENETIWKKTHLLAGKFWFVGGLCIALLFLMPEALQMGLFFAFTLIICLVPTIYSYLEFRKTKQSLT